MICSLFVLEFCLSKILCVDLGSALEFSNELCELHFPVTCILVRVYVVKFLKRLCDRPRKCVAHYRRGSLHYLSGITIRGEVGNLITHR